MKSRHFTSVIQFFLTPEAFLPFLFGSACLGFEPRPVGAYTRPPEKHQGLILLVSRQEPCEKAIAYHQPKLKQCWLLCSAQTLSIAQQVQKNYTEVCLDNPLVVNDLNNPLEVKQLTEAHSTAPPPLGTRLSKP